MRRTIIRTIFAAVLGTTLAAACGAQAQMTAGDATVVLGQPLTLNLGVPPAGTDCSTQAATLNAQGLVLVANGQTIPGASASFGCSAKGELVGTASTSIAGNGDDATRRRAAWQTAFSGFFSLAGAKPLPVAFGKYVFNDQWSIQGGRMPTLIGTEAPFTFQNLNISRGLLFNQENIINHGVQVNYSDGPWSASVAGPGALIE